MNVEIFLRSVEVTEAEEILKNLDVAKTSRIDYISAKFLKDVAPITAIHLANINLLIKFDTFRNTS